MGSDPAIKTKWSVKAYIRSKDATMLLLMCFQVENMQLSGPGPMTGEKGIFYCCYGQIVGFQIHVIELQGLL